MGKFIHLNAAIECNSAEIISRKITYSSALKIGNIGICFTYKCSRNSEAKIIKELSPKISKYCYESKLDLNDILESDSLHVIVNKTKPYSVDLINHSGRHKAQTFTTKEFTFAKISKQLNNIPEISPELKFTLK